MTIVWTGCAPGVVFEVMPASSDRLPSDLSRFRPREIFSGFENLKNRLTSFLYRHSLLPLNADSSYDEPVRLALIDILLFSSFSASSSLLPPLMSLLDDIFMHSGLEDDASS